MFHYPPYIAGAYIVTRNPRNYPVEKPKPLASLLISSSLVSQVLSEYTDREIAWLGCEAALPARNSNNTKTCCSWAEGGKGNG